ncbi:MAG: gamma-glutamylcyclotransferase family protein [Wenzhouxiangella sp.]
MSASPHLFVYGTLRRDSGSPAHDWLAQRADNLGAAWIQGRLYRIARYPGLVLSDHPAERVVGELYALREPETVLAELDRYEECSPGFPEPTEYVRCQRPVTLQDGKRCSAWVYLYNRSVTERARIVTGDFLHPRLESSQ